MKMDGRLPPKTRDRSDQVGAAGRRFRGNARRNCVGRFRGNARGADGGGQLLYGAQAWG
jgi:hypothetical protein